MFIIHQDSWDAFAACKSPVNYIRNVSTEDQIPEDSASEILTMVPNRNRGKPGHDTSGSMGPSESNSPDSFVDLDIECVWTTTA